MAISDPIIGVNRVKMSPLRQHKLQTNGEYWHSRCVTKELHSAVLDMHKYAWNNIITGYQSLVVTSVSSMLVIKTQDIYNTGNL